MNITRFFFFYRLRNATRPFFHSVIVPNLKSSLSSSLSHYLPLVWDSLDQKPSHHRVVPIGARVTKLRRLGLRRVVSSHVVSRPRVFHRRNRTPCRFIWENNNHVSQILGPDMQTPTRGTRISNCVSATFKMLLPVETFMGEEGFLAAARFVSDSVEELDETVAFKILEILVAFSTIPPGSQLVSVAGSTRFGVYGLDFEWGKPERVVIVSIDQCRFLEGDIRERAREERD